ncbi:asparagine synthase (glutamine-hydrolyzing) [Cryomorpha ignava]|uniref:asparagine synthase (glutamine-hydrolyzing) n=1 Tax=Cryomorpha ignava TaxID=101383 RepID=A0A7K3WX10_9FLAO|nr:asparagine synthase (glutamine-hydrolyzing) [Cryomorpha ignava]NEN25175.1 asparagine synthase (glutamine-hydrolyzing) [Cryomorpha ignava]
MCGIAGIWNLSVPQQQDAETITKMVRCIERRGPDAQAISKSNASIFGHTRLSIIDVNERSNQPMSDSSERYTLVFNGEIYNYKELKADLERKFNTQFITNSDTEVLLYGLIHYGSGFIQKLNGFFAFGFYDTEKNSLIVARDRFGIKPLYYQQSENRFIFSSSLTALMQGIDKPEICLANLATYLQLSYSPAPATILKNAFKLMPGTFLKLDKSGMNETRYYEVPDTAPFGESQKGNAVDQFKSLLEKSVQDRLQADVPLGTFLSGGFDSSVIALLASRDKPDIPVFTIGFPDQPFYDESDRAKAIARHLGLKPHIINLREREIDEKLSDILDAFDEPFADSSAILVNILSEYAAKEVKVALSGDGADEIMGGYNKQRALLRSINGGLINSTLKATQPLWEQVPESRNTKWLNRFRKLKRYSTGLDQGFSDRYFEWSSFTPRALVNELIINQTKPNLPDLKIDSADFNTVLEADLNLVLPNDMLHKVDLMSMHQSLEVRVPFLDHNLVDFLFKLPASEKINKNKGKIILRKAFEDEFPKGFFNKSKKGFEAPLSHWLQGPLLPFSNQYLSKTFIEKQGIFNFEFVKKLEMKAKSKFPGDTPHSVWALLVFQYWYDKHF